MTQVHKQFTNEQVKVLFQGYTQGNLPRAAVEELLEIGKTRFFALLKAYRHRQEYLGGAHLVPGQDGAFR